MSRLTVSVSAFIYICVLMVLPLLTVPFVGISADLQKGDLAGFALGIALLTAGLLAVFSRRAFALPFSGILFLGLPLAAVGIASAIASGNSPMSWWGSGLELGTVASLLLFAAAILSGGLLLAAPVQFLQQLFIGSVTVAGIVTAISAWLTGTSALFSSWPELSAALSAAILCAALRLDWSERLRGTQWLLLIELALLLSLFFLFFTGTIAVVLIVFLVGNVLVQAALYESGLFPRMPVVSSIVALAFFTLLIFGVQNPVFSVPPQIRPSLSATEFVGNPVFANSIQGALLGSGPGTFSSVWDKYRPTEFNATPLWSTSFGAGFTSVATLVITLGSLGFIALMYCIIAYVLWIWPRMSSKRLFVSLQGKQGIVAAACGVGLFSFGVEFFYATGLTLFLIGAAQLGFAVRMLLPEEVHLKKVLTAPLFRLPAGLLLFAAGAFLVWLTTVQFIAGSYQSFAYKAFVKSDFPTASADFSHAARLWPTPQLYADASRASFELFQIALAQNASDKTSAESKANEALSYANKATTLGRHEYEAWLSRSSLLVAFVGAKIPNAEVEASTSLATASTLAPNRVEAPYLQAVLAFQLGKNDQGKMYLAKALALKPDYAPALALQKELLPQ